jgi:hypothetical protein
MCRVLMPLTQIVTSCRQYATRDMVVLPADCQDMITLRVPVGADCEGVGSVVDDRLFLDIERSQDVPPDIVDAVGRALNGVSPCP